MGRLLSDLWVLMVTFERDYQRDDLPAMMMLVGASWVDVCGADAVIRHASYLI